jgi:hypothetical protein
MPEDGSKLLTENMVTTLTSGGGKLLSSEYGGHSHGEAGAVAGRECAYAPAYLHQPPSAGGTAAPGGGGPSWPPRDHHDLPLCASGAQPFTGWDSGVGAAEYAS